MNCLIENDYIKGTFQKKNSPMYSQMNNQIENDYIKRTFNKKKSTIYSQMNWIIKNDYINNDGQIYQNILLKGWVYWQIIVM